MAWFSRDKKVPSSDPQVAAPTPDAAGLSGAPLGPGEGAAANDAAGGLPEMGKYGPKVAITSFDTAPAELGWQLPLNGELFTVLPGPDRPDYSVLVLAQPLHFYPGETFDLGRLEDDQRTEDRRGRPMVRVHALLVCARFVGQQLHPGMSDLPVNVAYVIDNSLARDERVDFAKIEFAAVGLISEGHREAAPSHAAAHAAVGPDADAGTEPPTDADPDPAAEADPATEGDTGNGPAEAARTVAQPGSDEQPDGDVGADALPLGPGEIGDERPPEMVVMGEVCAEAATALRSGIADQRFAEVENLTVTLALDEAHRVTGLSGNADGQPPVPTPETFERLNGVLARLAELPGDHDVAQLTLTIEGEAFSSDVEYRS